MPGEAKVQAEGGMEPSCEGVGKEGKLEFSKTK